MQATVKSRLLVNAAAFIAIAAAGSATASASDPALRPAEEQAAPAAVQLIANSRLGCGESMPMWTASTGGSQCAFDSATRGARFSARQDLGSGSIEAYAMAAHSTHGAFTPDDLLIAPDRRINEATNFFLVGIKGSAFDNRLKVTGEFSRTDRVVDELIDRDWALADQYGEAGTSATVRLDATLADRPGLRWSVTGEYRSVSEDYSVGRSSDLSPYFAMPGTRLALSTVARLNWARLSAGIAQSRTPFGTSASRKAGLDLDGISLRLMSRDTNVEPLGSTLLESRTHTDSAYLDLDFHLLAATLFPELGDLPFVVPATVNLSYLSGGTESRYEASTEHYSRSGFGIDGNWETPIGETMLSYWRDTRTGLTDGDSSRTSEMVQLSHLVRRGNWRFGLDASLSRYRGDGTGGYDDRSVSFGQSVAYSAPDGPELRLQLGQDRGVVRMNDDSYASSDHYSRVTASLDLSRYLQKRFERPDLKLTVDYRKALERSDSEMNLYDELVERWVDGYRREGFLLSFGMKL